MQRYRTPLRYPGGKQRLAPFIREVLQANGALGCNYVEPYAGGAGVAMELLLDGQVSQVHLNDSSLHIFALWKTLLGDPEAFARRIARTALTVESWRKHRAIVQKPLGVDLDDLGFSTFVLNRCNRSGVLTAGVIGGLAQVGQWRIDARFPRNELIKRVEAIGQHRDKISLTNLDAEDFLLLHVNAMPSNTFVYCDPPYFQRAERLYLNAYKPEDHSRLSRVIQEKLARPWLVSYDGHPRIVELYSARKHFVYSLQYSAMTAYTGTEVFIFADEVKIPTESQLPYVAAALATIKRSARLERRRPAAITAATA